MAIPNEPLTRAEQYLNKIATGSGNTPDEPLTRIKMYLAEIAKNEGGGGSGGGAFVITKRKQSDSKASQGVLKITHDKIVLDKTYNEIVAAVEVGRICVIYYYIEEQNVFKIEYVSAYTTLEGNYRIFSRDDTPFTYRYASDSGDGVLVLESS